MINIDHACKRANELNDQHDLTGAIDAWSSILSHDPTCARARYALTRLCLEVSDFERAKALCEAGEKLPHNAITLSASSHYFQSVYQTEDALERSERAWRQDTDSALAAYAYHGSLLLSGDEVGARDFLASIDGRFSDHSELEVERASQPEYGPTQQEVFMTEVVRRFPHCRTARFVLITVLNGVHQQEATEAALTWLLKRSPDSGDIQALGALIALQHDLIPLAESRSNKAVALNPLSVLGHFVQFHLALFQGDRAKANHIVAHIESWTSGSISALTLLPQMYEQLNDFQAIREQLIHAHRAGNRSPEIGLSLSRMALKQDDAAEALSWVEAARDGWPEHFDATIDLARIHVEQGDMERAAGLVKSLASCEAVDELKLRIQAAHEGNMETLVQSYEIYLKKYPSFDFVWGTLLRYYLESGQSQGVEWLLNYPRSVPKHVRFAVEAYRAVVSLDTEQAEVELQGFLDTRTTDARWTWCWELVLESLEAPELNHWLAPLAEAAKVDGL